MREDGKNKEATCPHAELEKKGRIGRHDGEIVVSYLHICFHARKVNKVEFAAC